MTDRVTELEREIRHHQELYYNGDPQIPDAEFDLLWDELGRIDPENPILHEVGADRSDRFAKRRHVMPMGSQEKAADPDAFRKWADRSGHAEYVVQHKLDGASIELQYQDGSFTYGVTRGDGTVGDDVTANVRRMKGVADAVGDSFTGAVRGEVLLSRELHRTKYADKANPRNTANGLMKRKDGIGAEDLQVVCYDALDTRSDTFFESEIAKLEWLAANGFCVVEHRVVATPDDVIAYREAVGKQREQLPFDIDGLVVKGRDIDIDDTRRARPERQIAFKFELEEAASTLRDVIWSTSGALYTPIGVIDPVRLAGTTVKRANLVNPRMLREMDLRIGSRVAVTKRGEIIPKIERLIENPDESTAIELPTTCERCETLLVDEGTRLYCPNDACPKRAYYRIRKWLDVLDIRDFGDAILGKLFESGRVTDIADLYSLTEDDLTAFDRMGPTLARKILRNLGSVNEIPLSRFVAGLNIESVGELVMDKVVVAGYDTLDALREASPDDLASVNGIGDVLAATITTGIAALEPVIDDVLRTGRIRIATPVRGGFQGRSFCFTGALTTMTRAQAQDRVRRAGGAVAGSVTRDLSYLVTNDAESGSSKNRKARDLGVAIITEHEFARLLDAADRAADAALEKTD